MLLAGGPSTSADGSVRIMWQHTQAFGPSLKKRAIWDVAVEGVEEEERRTVLSDSGTSTQTMRVM
jgi:hypothetical protein